jgi:hypothetical protein
MLRKSFLLTQTRLLGRVPGVYLNHFGRTTILAILYRSDLKELRDLDLGGAPYGYTPFCDSNADMEGFRFWKQGYWKNHLAGKPYHISALYVVDLVRFRQVAAGDRLRGQYQALSQDPNSLSNLDQDLPNNMIHQVNSDPALLFFWSLI